MNWPFESKLWWNTWSKLYFKLTKSWNQQLLVNYADNSNSLHSHLNIYKKNYIHWRLGVRNVGGEVGTQVNQRKRDKDESKAFLDPGIMMSLSSVVSEIISSFTYSEYCFIAVNNKYQIQMSSSSFISITFWKGFQTREQKWHPWQNLKCFICWFSSRIQILASACIISDLIGNLSELNLSYHIFSQFNKLSLPNLVICWWQWCLRHSWFSSGLNQNSSGPRRQTGMLENK